MMRLDKYLAEMGVGTRQEVKKQIRQGKAAVNGTVVKAADTKIDETCDEVTICGRNISYQREEAKGPLPGRTIGQRYGRVTSDHQ